MKIGMIGLGRMGANMARRLRAGGHDCVVHDIDADSVARMVADGFAGSADIEEFIGLLEPPRNVCIPMAPGGRGPVWPSRVRTALSSKSTSRPAAAALANIKAVPEGASTLCR